MQKLKLWLTTGVLLLTVLSSSAQEVHRLTLQQALDYAQKNSVQVKNALLDVELQQQVNREVTGSAYPQLSASGNLTYNAKLPVFIFDVSALNPLAPPGDEQRVEAGVKWGSTGGVTLSQLLFDGQVFTGLKARSTLIDYKEKAAEVTTENIRTSVTKIYYQLVVSKTQLALMDSNMALVEKNIHDTKIMYDNGFAEKLDLDKLDVQLANLTSQKAQVATAIQNGYLGLKMLIGMPIKDQLILTDELREDNIKNGLLDTTAFNYEQRKDFQAAMLGLKLSKFEIQRYQLSKIPTLNVSGYWNEQNQTNDFSRLYSSNAFWFPVSAIALNINIPIFNGFATNARIKQAKIKLEQTQNQIDFLKLNIDQQRDSSLNVYRTAIADMDFQKQNMVLADRVYQQTKKKYEEGIGSQIEIDNARVQLQTAQNNYYNALYNAVVARVDYLKAIGKI